MSTDRDTTRIVRSWLRADDNESADRVLGAVLDRLGTTPQRHATRWPARRSAFMDTAVRVALAAAAVVAVALLGYAYFTPPDIGSAPVVPSSEPGTSIDPDLPLLVDQEGPLTPGTYVVTEVEPYRLAITVPNGWSRNVVPDTVWTQDSTVVLWFGRVDELNADPCAASAQMTALAGSAVDDLADALADLPTLNAQVRPISISGFSGVAVDLSVADPADRWCEGASDLWRIRDVGGGTVGVGLPGRFGTLSALIVDVNGDRIVVAAAVRGATSSTDMDGLRSVLESIEMQAP